MEDIWRLVLVAFIIFLTLMIAAQFRVLFQGTAPAPPLEEDIYEEDIYIVIPPSSPHDPSGVF